jgi:serine/threonine protein phosphatase PrpC
MGNITAKTTQGKRTEHEDRLVVLPCDDGYLLAICDGHRGHGTASAAITRLVKMSMEHPSRGLLPDAAIARDFLVAVVQRLAEETVSDLSGSTLSLVHISEEAKRVDIAVLGDSPVVAWLDKQNCWVSPEHNVRSHVSDCQYVREHGGEIHGSYLFADPHRRYGLQLTRALGDSPFASVLQREAEYFSFPLHDNSVVAVMSDGVYDENFISGKEDLVSLPHASADAIVHGALLRGSRDNVSAIVWCAQ